MIFSQCGVCVCGVIDEKGREHGREKRTPKNTILSEVGDFCRKVCVCEMGDLLRLWVFIGGCCDVISRVGSTRSTVWDS